MTNSEVRSWLVSLIRQRRALVKMGKNHKNAMLMNSICERLGKLLGAYPYKGDSIRGFIRRNYTDILLIIPSNGSEKHNLEILNSISICEEKNSTSRNCSTNTEEQHSFTQHLLLL